MGITIIGDIEPQETIKPIVNKINNKGNCKNCGKVIPASAGNFCNICHLKRESKRYYRKDCVVEYTEPKLPPIKPRGWRQVGYDRSGQLCIWDE